MSHATEFASFYHEARPRARKAHRCSACMETVQPGSTYTRLAIGGDGSVETVKQCNRCRAIYDAIAAKDPREPISVHLDCGETWESIWGTCPDDVAALAFMFPHEEP